MENDHGTSSRPGGPTRDTDEPVAILAVVAGALFGIVALLHVPGIWYAVIGIGLGAGYALLAILPRRGGGRDRTRR